MVRAEKLHGDSLVRAMRAGDFYASSGVYLDDFSYDPATRELTVQIRPNGEDSFRTEFIGTRKTYDPSAVGEVLGTAEGISLKFRVPDDALYVRATITSSRDHPNPSFEEQKEQAWVQPVGWRN